jgi:hypothetical protein
MKKFHLTERHYLQFRAEFFNAFNMAHFNDPEKDITSSTVGQIFGAAEPRDIQFGFKVSW